MYVIQVSQAQLEWFLVVGYWFLVNIDCSDINRPPKTIYLFFHSEYRTEGAFVLFVELDGAVVQAWMHGLEQTYHLCSGKEHRSVSVGGIRTDRAIVIISRIKAHTCPSDPLLKNMVARTV